MTPGSDVFFRWAKAFPASSEFERWERSRDELVVDAEFAEILSRVLGAQRARGVVLEWSSRIDFASDDRVFMITLSERGGAAYRWELSVPMARVYLGSEHVLSAVYEAGCAMVWRLHRPRFRIGTRSRGVRR